MKYNGLIIGMTILGLGCVSVLGYIAFFYEDNRVDLLAGVVKLCFQLIGVAVIGGIISLLIKQRELLYSTSQESIATRKDFLNNLGSSYRKVKLIRRILRSYGLKSTAQDPVFKVNKDNIELLSEQMQSLNQIQLELEGMGHELRYKPALAIFDDFFSHIHSMEDYLRKILTEFENSRSKIEKGVDFTSTELERLNEFTISTRMKFVFKNGKSYRFLENFWRPYETMLSIISKLDLADHRIKLADNIISYTPKC